MPQEMQVSLGQAAGEIMVTGHPNISFHRASCPQKLAESKVKHVTHVGSVKQKCLLCLNSGHFPTLGVSILTETAFSFSNNFERKLLSKSNTMYI